MTTVSSFIADFNKEALRRRASGLRAASIQDHEISAFAESLERLPSSVAAGSLLCALASCVRSDTRAADVEMEFWQAMSA
jgi:hypothetical protein